MAKIALLPCSKRKMDTWREVPAKDLYDPSPLFRLYRRYAHRVCKVDSLYILSAKYGLLAEEDRVYTYEARLKYFSREDRAAWVSKVRRQLSEKVTASDTLLVFAGSDYHKDLDLRSLTEDISFPVIEGLPKGRRKHGWQMQWLLKEIKRAS